MTQKILLIFSFVFFALLSNAQSLPKKIGIINDFENIFDKKQEKKMAQLIKKELTSSKDEIVVVTVASLGSFANIEAYAEALLAHWNMENGVLLVLSKGVRKVRIQYSAGLGDRLTDNESKKIIEAQIIPEFKAERYFEGVFKGIEAIGKELK